MFFSCCSTALMHTRPVHCVRMFYCTLFSYCPVCNGLGVSRQTVWSLEIGSELSEPQSINNCDWFLIPTDHPQCVWLIQSYKLAVPSEIDLKLLLVREGAQTMSWTEKVRLGIGTWALFLDWLGECTICVAALHITEISLLKKMQKVYRAAQCNVLTRMRAVLFLSKQISLCVVFNRYEYIVMYRGCSPSTLALFFYSEAFYFIIIYHKR